MTTNRDLGPRRQPEQARSRARVEAILAAAGELLAERGVDRVSMTDIAVKSNMSKAAVYRYFPTKQAVIRQLAVRELRADRRYLEGLLDPDAPDREAILEPVLRQYCEALSTDSYLVQLSAAVRADVELSRIDHQDTRLAAARIAAYLEPDASSETQAALELQLLLALGLIDGLLQVASRVEPHEVAPLVDAFVDTAMTLVRRRA